MHRIVLACLALGLSATAFAQRGAILYAAACAGCHGPDLTNGTAPPPPEFLPGAPAPTGLGPTQAELTAAYSSNKDWLYHTHDYSGTRYVQSTQITPANASQLRVACAFQLGEQSNF